MLPLEIKYKIIENLPFDKIIISEYVAKKLYPIYKDNIEIYIKRGNLSVIKWLYSQKLLDHHRHMDDLLLLMAELDHIHVIKWMYDNKIGKCHNYTLSESFDSSDETILFLHNSYKVCSSQLVNRLFYNRRLDLAKKLYDCCRCTKSALITACYGGDLDIIRFLFDKGISFYNRRYGELIDAAASKGHLDIVIFLHQNTDEISTVDAIDFAAEYGHLNVVKWLDENVNIRCTTRAIDKASEKGNFCTVEYLVKREYPCTEYSVIKARRNGYEEIVHFLQENVKQFQPYKDYPLGIRF